jgi:hypothetical protein
VLGWCEHIFQPYPQGDELSIMGGVRVSSLNKRVHILAM